MGMTLHRWAQEGRCYPIGNGVSPQPPAGGGIHNCAGQWLEARRLRYGLGRESARGAGAQKQPRLTRPVVWAALAFHRCSVIKCL